jgi:phage FluMu protein Com
MKTVTCQDCGKEYQVSERATSAKYCPECKRAKRAKWQRERYGTQAMVKEMDTTTALIVIRAMEGRRHQAVKELAEELHRDENELQTFIDGLKASGEWGRVWAEMQKRDKTADIYETAIC